MTFKYFFSTLFFSSLVAFAPHAALEDSASSARQSTTSLAQPIVDSRGMQEDDPDLAQLKEKATAFQAQFSDPVIEGIMTLGSRYVIEMQSPNPEEDGDDLIPPSFNDLLDILSTLADIESAPYDRPTGTVSSFAYNALNGHANISPPSHQIFYLKLFADILSQTNFDETIADKVISWTLSFLRFEHSEQDCSDIARAVRRYIQDNPGENFEMSDLQVALQEEETWEDADILANLIETLNLEEAVHNPSPADDAALSKEGIEGLMKTGIQNVRAVQAALNL